MSLLKLLTAAVAALLLVAAPRQVDSTEIICYWGAWSSYRIGDGKVTVNDLDPTKCSVYIYSFAVLDASSHVMVPFDNQLDVQQGGYTSFVALKQQNPSMKAVIALGGYTDSQSSKYSQLLASAQKRANFVREALAFLQTYGFDGLDLDYEYPSAGDRAGFAALVGELAAEFRPRGLWLSAAVSASQWRLQQGYDAPALAAGLDMINLMTYDLHGSWESTADHHSPLYSRTSDSGSGLDSDSAVGFWMAAGAPAARLALGMPVYGRSWRVFGAQKTPPVAGSGAGTAGMYTAEAGYLSYLEICMAITQNGWTKVQDATGKVGPYAYSSSGEWVGYDDIEMITMKTEYAVSRGLGGVMIWDAGSSDIRDMCGDGAWPLLTAMNAVIGDSGGSTTSSSTTSTTTATSATTTTVSTSTPPTSATSTSQPGGVFVCPEAAGLFPDPGDCAGFYQCWTSVAVHHQCPDGLLWDNQLQYCNWEDQVSCPGGGGGSSTTVTSSSSTTSTTTTATSTTSTAATTSAPATTSTVVVTTQSPEQFVCPSTSGLFADPADCAGYYQCWEGVPTHYTCAAGTIWDVSITNCNWESLVTCSTGGGTTPSTTTTTTAVPFVCPSPNGLFADPNDCASYYNCHYNSFYHYTCATGTLWDTNITNCNWASQVTCT